MSCERPFTLILSKKNGQRERVAVRLLIAESV